MNYTPMIALLEKRFGQIMSHGEIEQEIMLAHVRVGNDNPAHVFVAAKNAIIDEVRRRRSWQDRMCSIDNVVPPCDPGCFLRRMEQAERWSRFRAELPYFARKLADITEQEAHRFSARGVDIWRRKSQQVLRESIVETYEEWRADSVRRPPRYRKAREVLTRGLRKYNQE